MSIETRQAMQLALKLCDVKPVADEGEFALDTETATVFCEAICDLIGV